MLPGFAEVIVLFSLFVGFCSQGLAEVGSAGMRMLAATDFSGPGLRGLNLGMRQSPALGESDFRDLAATGANLVRIILPAKKCKSCKTYGISEADLAYADFSVAMGERFGFYVLITLSPQPAGDRAEYWHDQELQQSVRENWAALAARYRGREGVAGYDLINEPVPNSWFDKQGAWRSFSSSLIDAIRGKDPDHVIVVEPIEWGHAIGMAGLSPLPYGNLVYSFHFYEPYKLTHQGLYENRESIRYPSPDWDKRKLAVMLDPVRSFVAKNKLPILVGEFSIVRWAPNNSVQAYLDDVIDLFEKEGWPWLYHSFRESPAWDAEMPSSAEHDPINRRLARHPETSAMQLLKGYFRKNKQISN